MTHHYVAIYCDRDGCMHEGRADVITGTVDDAYEVLRAHLATRLGWQSTDAGDFCPIHHEPTADAVASHATPSAS